MNKLKINLLCLSCFFFVSLYAQNTYNATQIDKDGEKHLIGLSNRSGLLQAPFQEWFNTNYDAYEIDQKMLKKCKGKHKYLTVKIFMGTWCGDSKREIPIFYKLIDEMGIAEEQITLVNLDQASDRYKQSPTGEEKGLNIHRVPTFIFYQDQTEIGRIVESPVTNFETDIAQILNGMPTAPNYKGVMMLNEILNSDTVNLSQEHLLSMARQIYREVKNDKELNTYGYVLKARQELDKAIAVFEINRMIHPKVANVYDSLAEAYLEKGNEAAALFYYKKLVSIEPDNENALAQIKRIDSDAQEEE
ncbi:MAG: thioredoxin family protein [Bacteroidota bacterium]